MKNNKIVILLFLILFGQTGCEEYLDVKPNKDIVILKDLKDYQALLDAIPRGMNDMPSMQVLMADNVLIDDINFNAFRSTEERNAYMWNEQIFEIDTDTEWSGCYGQVFYANLVLEGLEEFIPADDFEKQEKDRIRGNALFHRASNFFVLLDRYAQPYDPSTAATLPGIPLRTVADVNARFPRATIAEGYDFIINDLSNSLDLLPDVPDYKTRASRSAVLGLLARIYLTQGEYEMAFQYAGEALQINDDLMVFADLDPSATYPVHEFNEEVVFYNQLMTFSFFSARTATINPELYNSYDSDDLRKVIFFDENSDGSVTFKGHYTGNYSGFGGLATDELYLIMAESLVRIGEVEEGLSYLNDLLETRFASGTYIPYQTVDQNDALEIVLEERRKELVFRGLRWSDLRRLNKETDFQVTMQRTIEGVEYTLAPGDPRYTLQIPPDELRLGGLQPNPR